MSQKGIARAGGDLFADPGPDGLLHRAFLRGEGFDADQVRRRPVIGICTSYSDLSPCNAGLRAVANVVKRGIVEAGGIGLEFPTISLSEPFLRPTSMLLRNLMSMDVEEMIASSPIDGVVLLAGCDKTVPAQLMGAISADRPAVMVTAGPRPVSCWRGAAMTIDDVWPLIEERRLGHLDDTSWRELESSLNTGVGTCNVLGTAITMAAVAEVLGFALPGSALHPAGSAEHETMALAAGRAIVELVAREVTPRDLMTAPALDDAIRMVCALGGSTNALVHLEAIAGRAGHRIGVERMRQLARSTPLIVDVRPTGQYLLSDLQRAGGIPAVVAALGDRFEASRPTATGESWAAASRALRSTPHASLRSIDDPLSSTGIVVLTGTLAPRGAVVKTSERAGAIRRHRGRAVVFDSVTDVNARIDDEALEVEADSILVLRGVGALGAPGMPEVGHVPIPAKLARAGISDMVRITDARMSGTATGTVILHVTPEAAAGGPIGLVRDGDWIEVDLDAGTVDLVVTEEELGARSPWTGGTRAARGYGWLYDRHVLQPDEGCDFDFLLADGPHNMTVREHG